MRRVCTKELCRFMVDCLKAVGTNPKASAALAELLVQAERMGHSSHGLNRFEKYIDDIITGACEPNNVPCVIKETASTALVDANNVLGATAAHYSMDVAICKAKTTGIGWVTVRGSNHFGMGGFWCLQAVHQGMIGVSLTNGSPLMAPTRSVQVALGTNPIAVAAPAACGETFYLDMSTTVVSLGKIETYLRKCLPLPSGWAQAPNGNITTDAKLALATKALMPLGGSEIHSGFKGYGLAAMVELFCGISSGAAYGHNVRSWGKGSSGPANLGHCFVAIDPGCFAPGFGERLFDCMDYWRKLEPVDPCKPVLAPGDTEKYHAEKVDKLRCVTVIEPLMQSSEALAKKLKVVPMRFEK